MKSRSTTPALRRSANSRSSSTSITWPGDRRIRRFPGGLVSNHSLNGTPEFAYGVTDWWEVGLYLPFADHKISNSSRTRFKLGRCSSRRTADQRNFFYGVNFEFSNTTPPFAQTRLALEIRPIIGDPQCRLRIHRQPDRRRRLRQIWRGGLSRRRRAWRESSARISFVGLRILRRLWRDRRLLRSLPSSNTRLFAVTDFKFGVFDVDFGVGHGLTPASDRWVVKTIIGYAFPVPGSNSDASEPSSCRTCQSDGACLRRELPQP